MSGKWPGRSFLLSQRGFVLGPSYLGAGASLFLLIGLSLLCLLVPCRYFLTEKSNPAPIILVCILSGSSLCFFLLTATTEPGFIPRQYSEWSQGPVQTPKFGSVLLGYDGRGRDVPVRGAILRLRYCDTCCVYRPPRASHCHICDACVMKFDHHCPWLGTCIGQRNYSFFLLFLTSVSLLCFLSIAVCLSHISFLFDSKSASDAAAEAIGTWVLLAGTVPVLMFVLGLWSFHMYLSARNRTTHENIKKTMMIYNPYSLLNPFLNLLSAFRLAPRISLLRRRRKCNEDEDYLAASPSVLAVAALKFHRRKEEFGSRETEPMNSLAGGRVPILTSDVFE